MATKRRRLVLTGLINGLRKRGQGDYSFSTETSVALMIAKTLSPCLRFIRLTEPVVMIDVTSPAAVRITSSDTTLSETMFSIVPGRRLRMLVLISLDRRRAYPCAGESRKRAEWM